MADFRRRYIEEGVKCAVTGDPQPLTNLLFFPGPQSFPVCPFCWWVIPINSKACSLAGLQLLRFLQQESVLENQTVHLCRLLHSKPLHDGNKRCWLISSKS